MNDNKITISRGYTRKLNLGNYIKTKPYESLDVFANYSQEIPAETSKQELKKLSKELFDRAKLDVDDSASKILMEEINKLPRKDIGLPIDKKAKHQQDFIEDLEEN